MPVTSEARRMAPAERQRLSAIGGAPGGAWRSAWWSWPMLICALVLAAWFLLRGLEPLWGAGHRGPDPVAPELIASLGAALLLAAIAIWASLRATRSARRNRRRVFGAYWDDLDAGMVDEERYEFLALLSVRDGETGVTVHLLRVDEGRCLVVYDKPGDGRAACAGDAQLRRRALLRRAPRSGLVLSLRFEGEALASEPSDALGWATPGWEWDGRLWDLEWPQIEQRLARGVE
ncbi:hypothetical protein GLE_1445 [Lysobacter enzymogenes]|uniref:Uncharacterized protein n=1 Tax=Lysobacter enzymogenes TaxID=69 RepID=A0A0S2DE83_LYSEN|nr:hypothetical protein [Lysobacter enzymogenes]ALN56802.1 hypothetical protein GLE_1445 [Lysobacter enzymogenes]QCW25547.1 hypothetical protein FE772_07600 [Lysobacter enzymogenes]